MTSPKLSAGRLLRDAWGAFDEDRVPTMAAALAYYTIFSVAPLLLVLIGVASVLFGEDAARTEVIRAVRGFVGASAAVAIDGMLEKAGERGAGRIALWMGVAGLLLGASSAAAHLKDSLEVIWHLPKRPPSGVLAVLRARGVALVTVLAIGLVLLASLLVSASIAAAGARVAARLQGGEIAWLAADFVLSVLVATGLFALLFRTLPSVRVAWGDVWTGAVFTALLFVIGKLALALWLGKGASGSALGAAASLLALLVWVYYSALIVFFGAEFTQVHASARGGTPPAWRSGFDSGA